MSPDSRRYNRQFRPEFSRLHSDRDLRWVVPLSVRYVVVVTGERFAGKSAALAYLAERKGFQVYSLATTLRDTAVRLGIPLEPRSSLQDLGDELRAHFDDPAYLARQTLRQIHRDHLYHSGTIEPLRRVAVGGFKRVEELSLFAKLNHFEHLRLVAPREMRYQRAHESGVMRRELAHVDPPAGEDLSAFEEHIERRDLRGDDNPWTAGYGQAVEGLTAMGSAQELENDGTLADLYDRLDEEVRRLDSHFRSFSS